MHLKITRNDLWWYFIPWSSSSVSTRSLPAFVFLVTLLLLPVYDLHAQDENELQKKLDEIGNQINKSKAGGDTIVFRFLAESLVKEKQLAALPKKDNPSFQEIRMWDDQLLKLDEIIATHYSLRRNNEDLINVNTSYSDLQKLIAKRRTDLKATADKSRKPEVFFAYSFFTYHDIKRPGNQTFEDSKAWTAFREKYGMRKIEESVSQPGNILNVECKDIINIGLCLKIDAFDQLEIKSILKTVIPANNLNLDYLSTYDFDIQKLNKKKKEFLFIDLYQLFATAYMSDTTRVKGCCPDLPVMSPDEELADKLCGVARFNNGLELVLSSPLSVKHFTLRTDPGRKNNSQLRGTRDPMPRIEPRQYITIYERKKNNLKTQPVWWMTKEIDTMRKDKTSEGNYSSAKPAKFYAHQPFQIVDNNAILEVRFDQEELARNIFFYGNISLSARAGNNKIEVAPYSVIGKPQKSYGVNSKPIMEIADHFLRLRIEAMKGNEAAKGIKPILASYTEQHQSASIRMNKTIKAIEFLDALIDEADKQVPNISPFFSDSSPIWYDFFLLSGTKNQMALMDSLTESSERTKIIQVRDTLIQVTFSEFNVLLNSIKANAATPANVKAAADVLINQADKFLADLKRIRNDYFFFGDDKLFGSVRDAFKDIESAIPLTEQLTFLRDLKSRMIHKKRYAHLKTEINTNELPEIEIAIGTVLQNFLRPALRTAKFMEYFNQSGDESKDAFLQLILMTKIDFNEIFRSTQEAMVYFDKFVLPDGNLTSAMDPQFFVHLSKLMDAISEINRSSPELLKYLNEVGYNEKFSRISTDASATPLSTVGNKSSADQVIVAQEWEPGVIKDHTAYNSVRDNIALFAGKMLFSRLVFATIDLQKEGVKEGEYVYISVMWYNINGNTTTAEDGIELATAKFYVKNTGWGLAASESAFLITRVNEDFAKSQSLSPSHFKPTGGASLLWAYRSDKRVTVKSKLLRPVQAVSKWFEPSIGLNVSYLDFDTTKDFEIGLGPVIGLWDNRLFFTYGYNFSVRGDSPFYFGVGLSFYNLFATVKSKVTTNLNQ